MKIIVNHIQPHIAEKISNTQTAFVKSQHISDNTILMREVLYYFQANNYTEQSFMLKVDINKAFDTIAWPFVHKAMLTVNMPLGLIRIINNCLQTSRVTIMINGSGQGFITPSRGLRQECPLSPYIFILAAEFLSRQLQQHQAQGSIKGISLARSALPLTYALYADDLMLMGKATMAEVRKVKSVLQ